jgi:hypothetical protein
MDIQKLVNARLDASAKTRSEYNLTLGQLIDALSAAPKSAVVALSDSGSSPFQPHSYRGYYSDLAFQEAPETRTVADVLKDAKKALGTTFSGYKGGDYLMSETTPLWASSYGYNNGRAMMSAGMDGERFVITVKQVD